MSDAIPIPPRFVWLNRGLILGVVWMAGIVGLRWATDVYADRAVANMVAGYHAQGVPIRPSDFSIAPRAEDSGGHWLRLSAQTPAPITRAADPLDCWTIRDDPWLVAEYPDFIDAQLQAAQPIIENLERAAAAPSLDWPEPPDWQTVIHGLSTNLAVRPVAIMNVSVLTDAVAGQSEFALRKLAILDRLSAIQARRGSWVSMSVGVQQSRHIRTAGGHVLAFAADSKSWRQPTVRAEANALIAQLSMDDDWRAAWAYSRNTERALMYDLTARFCDGRETLGSVYFTGDALPPALTRRLLAPRWKLRLVRHAAEVDRKALLPDAMTFAKLVASGQPSGIFDDIDLDVRWYRYFSVIDDPVEDRMLMPWLMGQANRRLVATALAAKLFQADHGRWPHTLLELTPGYLPDLPTDPFSPTADPLRYDHTPGGAMIYSRGASTEHLDSRFLSIPLDPPCPDRPEHKFDAPPPVPSTPHRHFRYRSDDEIRWAKEAAEEAAADADGETNEAPVKNADEDES